MVSMGILLFVAGFLVTLAAVGDGKAVATNNGGSSAQSQHASPVSEDVYLLCGILVSLAGVVLATVGPAVGILKGST